MVILLIKLIKYRKNIRFTVFIGRPNLRSHPCGDPEHAQSFPSGPWRGPGRRAGPAEPGPGRPAGHGPAGPVGADPRDRGGHAGRAAAGAQGPAGSARGPGLGQGAGPAPGHRALRPAPDLAGPGHRRLGRRIDRRAGAEFHVCAGLVVRPPRAGARRAHRRAGGRWQFHLWRGRRAGHRARGAGRGGTGDRSRGVGRDLRDPGHVPLSRAAPAVASRRRWRIPLRRAHGLHRAGGGPGGRGCEGRQRGCGAQRRHHQDDARDAACTFPGLAVGLAAGASRPPWCPGHAWHPAWQ